MGSRGRAVEDRRERGGRRSRLVLGELQRRHSGADTCLSCSSSPVSVKAASACAVSPRRTRTWRRNARTSVVSGCAAMCLPSGQAPGATQGGSRHLDTAAGDLETPSNHMEQHSCRRLNFGPERILPLHEPAFRLLQLSLPDQRASQHRVGHRHERLPGQAVPLRQLDRSPAPLHRQCGRPETREQSPVRQAVDLQEGPPDPARQSDTTLKVRFGFVESQRPELSDPQAGRRTRALFNRADMRSG
jgi:hypothetical protein